MKILLPLLKFWQGMGKKLSTEDVLQKRLKKTSLSMVVFLQ